jgi:anti-sigma regulatory factor (Ser/Thr protein kinase)
LGKANRAFYVFANQNSVDKIKKEITGFNNVFANKNLREDAILTDIKKQSGIFLSLPKNISDILDFAFLEMLNNAIGHSRSKEITIKFESKKDVLDFWIIDRGLGVFNSVRNKFDLPDDLTAIEHLLKGKQTTDPKHHTGQGIFFTSKLADVFTIISGRKRLRFIKSLDDVFIDDAKEFVGTKIFFSIKKDSKISAKKIFDAYSNEEFEFDKTKILIKLSKNSQGLVSRSEARRIMFGLDKFKEIVLDFKGVETAGQGFCDEVFRVWQNKYSRIKISYVNANENVEFMVRRALR